MGVNDRAYSARAEKKEKASQARNAKPSYDGWKAFVSLEMSAAMKESYRAWVIEDDVIWTWLEARLVDGYKLSLSFDKGNDSFVAALTCRAPNTGNSGLTLSGRAGDWFKALRVLSWKDAVYLENVWDSAPQNAPRSPDDIG